jgi:hypothetical protein
VKEELRAGKPTRRLLGGYGRFTRIVTVIAIAVAIETVSAVKIIDCLLSPNARLAGPGC